MAPIARIFVVVTLLTVALPGVASAMSAAQIPIKRTASGFNLFTPDQELEIGASATQALSKEFRPVGGSRVQHFLAGVTSALAGQAPPRGFTFSTAAVSTGRIDAWALPNGSIFIDRGLLALARNEGEVAGLIAHSMAHIILRHGTQRASLAYLERAGLVALGGWVGDDRTATQMVNAAGGFALESPLFTYADADEYEADALGAELMAGSGYDPVAMAAIFAAVRREKARNPGLAAFFRSHPARNDRETRIRNLANLLGHGRKEIVGGFVAARFRSRGNSPIASTTVRASAGSVDVPTPPEPTSVRLARPSTRYKGFNHPDSMLSIEFPDNWNAFASGIAVTFAPDGGLIRREHGDPRLVQGVVINYCAPFEDAVHRWNNSLKRNFAPFDRTRVRGILEDATDDLVRQVLRMNPYLSAPNKSARAETFDGQPGYSVRLRGISPVTGQAERVTVFTRLLPDEDVVYVACVTPASLAVPMERACARMARSLRVNDAAVHRDAASRSP